MPHKTATNNSAFHRIQIGDRVYMTNLFNAGAGGIADINSVSARLDIGVNNCPAIGDDDEFASFDACHISCDTAGEFKISYTGQIGDTAGGVRGFPAVVLGSAGGRNETWGVPCNSIGILYNKDNTSGSRGFRAWRDFVANPNSANPDDQRSHIYDLEDARRATGYPAMAADLPSTTISIVARDCGDPATVNGFIDTYWHDVSANGNTPVAANGIKLQDLAGTINGINGRCTRMWNLNFWWDHPDPSSEMSTRRFTGGRILGVQASNTRSAGNNKVRIDGRSQYIAIKWEKGGNNNFFYVAFVFTPSNKQPVINYNAYADYVLSDDFWNDILADSYAQAIIRTMQNPQSPDPLLQTSGNSAKAVTVRRPDTAFAVDSIQVGTEMWGTDAAGTTGATCFSRLDIDTGPNRKLVCKRTSCNAVVS